MHVQNQTMTINLSHSTLVVCIFLVPIMFMYNGTVIILHKNGMVAFYNLRMKLNNIILRCYNLKCSYKIKL